MNKKYELTDERNELGCRRIRLLRDVGSHKAGELLGYIGSEQNLSQYGDCLVLDKASVYSEARVFEDAKVYGNAEVQDNVLIYGNAEIYGNARVQGFEDEIWRDTRIFGNAKVYEDACVNNGAYVFGDSRVFGNAEVHGFDVFGKAEIGGDAKISENGDYVTFNLWWYAQYFAEEYITWTASNNMWCSLNEKFYGTSEEFIRMFKGWETDSGEGDCERMVRYVEAILENKKKYE